MNSISYIIAFFVLFVGQVRSVGLHNDYGGGGGLQEHYLEEGWCYQLEGCKESSPTSAWQRGTCKEGKRQSPINIRPLQIVRKKRRAAMRRHGAMRHPAIMSMMPMFSRQQESSSESEEGHRGHDSKDSPSHVTGNNRVVPSLVEQGILCSPKPRWQIIWVRGKPYKYWIQMNLCRLMLRQRAKFIMDSADKGQGTTEDSGSNNQTQTPRPTFAPSTAKPTTRPSKPPSSTTRPSNPLSTTRPPSPTTPLTIFPSPSPPTSKPIPTSRPPITQKPSRCDPTSPPSDSILNFSQVYKNYVMKEFVLHNNGHTMSLSKFVPETGSAPTFKWPEKDNAVYKLELVDFHWGPNDSVGSEHTIDGHSYPAEMHLVHYRCKEGEYGFDSFQDAVKSGRSDAIAVIAVFLEPDDRLSTSFIESIVYNYASVPRTGDKMLVICENIRLNLGEGLLKACQGYHYMGSFTTPPSCNEIVAWLVFKEPVKVARRDILALRGSVREGDYPLFMNYRSVQNNTQPVVRIDLQRN